MLSRVANSLYWLSRYLERAENLARLVEVNRYDALDINQGDVWNALLYTTSMENAYIDSGQKDAGAFVTFSVENPNSIRQCIAQSRENARMVRDQISEEIWRELNRFYLFISSDRAENSGEISLTNCTAKQSNSACYCQDLSTQQYFMTMVGILCK